MKKTRTSLVAALSASAVLLAAAPASAQRQEATRSTSSAAGSALTAQPTVKNGVQKSPTLDLEREWRVWVFSYWACRQQQDSGGLTVVYCAAVPTGWQTLPYGTHSGQPGIPSR